MPPESKSWRADLLETTSTRGFGIVRAIGRDVVKWRPTNDAKASHFFLLSLAGRPALHVARIAFALCSRSFSARLIFTLARASSACPSLSILLASLNWARASARFRCCESLLVIDCFGNARSLTVPESSKLYSGIRKRNARIRLTGFEPVTYGLGNRCSIP